jgi:general stress protein 26
MTRERRRAFAELGRLLDGIPVVMVTSVGADNFLRSRPMLLERLDDAGRLLFLTHLSSYKVREIEHHARVNVAFVGSNPERYVSISGRGTVTRDEARIHALWNPTYQAWFPAGPDDRDVAVLSVQIERVEYWDVPSSRLVRLWGVARALVTRQAAEAGEHRTFVLDGDAAD